ncbi:MAG: radical SAM protein [Candidatus Omnitrophica bacterium]|nr:radical SAM protein [Candidatus Omnitrophota bacterium]
MNVTLIHPPSQTVYDEFKRKEINRLPIGLAYIAAVAEQSGHDVTVLDAEVMRLSPEALGKHILAHDPDVVAITCTTPLYPIASLITDIVKKSRPTATTVLGGPHINALPRESMEGCLNADFAVYGEGETTFDELLKAIEADAGYERIPGLVYRRENRVLVNPARPLAADLDGFPFPARGKFPFREYRDPDRYNEPYTLFITSRGCPYRCIFCGSSATWGRKARFRSTGNVLKEIDEVVTRFNIRRITFCDDTFALDKRRVVALCRGMAERDYGIRFMCSARINTVDREMIESLAKAGCTEITFGVESGDREILKNICKDIDLGKVKPVFDMVKACGIKVHASYIIGNPGDTAQTIARTIDFAVESGADNAQFSISTPYPGTPLWQMAIEQDKLATRDFSRFKWYYSVVANLSGVSDEELIRFQRDAYARFAAHKSATQKE